MGYRPTTAGAKRRDAEAYARKLLHELTRETKVFFKMDCKTLFETVSTQVNALTDQQIESRASYLNNGPKRDKGIKMLLDSGANMFAFYPKDPHMRRLPLHKPLRATQPEGEYLHSIGEATLDDYLPMLPTGTTNGHIMPLKTQSLNPCSKLVDAGCRIELDQGGAKVIYKGQVILRGERENNMWHLNLPDRSAFTPHMVHGAH